MQFYINYQYLHGTPRYLHKYHGTVILISGALWFYAAFWEFLRGEWVSDFEYCAFTCLLIPEASDDQRMTCPEPQRVIKPAEWPQKLLTALIMLELSGSGQVRPGKHTEQRLSHTRIRPEDCDYDVTFWQAAADWVWLPPERLLMINQCKHTRAHTLRHTNHVYTTIH